VNSRLLSLQLAGTVLQGWPAACKNMIGHRLAAAAAAATASRFEGSSMIGRCPLAWYPVLERKIQRANCTERNQLMTSLKI